MTDERNLIFKEDEEFYEPNRMVVIFFASDGERKISCAISGEALADHFKSVFGSSANLLSAFRKNRRAIEHEVFRKYLNNELESDGSIIVRSSDLE